jgi:hypothetical protein
MKLLFNSLFALLIFHGAGPIALHVSAQDKGSNPLDSEGYRTVVEDMEIMRRIFEKTLSSYLGMDSSLNLDSSMAAESFESALSHLEKGKVKKESDGDLLSRLYSVNQPYFFTRFKSRGFYVPNHGIVFSLEVPVPAREVTVDKSELSHNDLWLETEKELRQGHTLNALKKDKRMKSWVLDSDVVDGVIDLLIKTVARHGQNVAHLDDEDRITLLVDFKGKSPDPLALLSRESSFAFYYFMAASNASRLFEHVIIQFPVSSLSNFQKTSDLADLKSLLEILRYPSKEAP